MELFIIGWSWRNCNTFAPFIYILYIYIYIYDSFTAKKDKIISRLSLLLDCTNKYTYITTIMCTAYQLFMRAIHAMLYHTYTHTYHH